MSDEASTGKKFGYQVTMAGFPGLQTPPSGFTQTVEQDILWFTLISLPFGFCVLLISGFTLFLVRPIRVILEINSAL